MDIAALLESVEGDNPSGTELRNDARFHAIERLLEPAAKSARVTAEVDLKPSAAMVPWDEISGDGQALAAEGRDLRLLVVLVRASYADAGFGGLADGLDMLAQTLTLHWDSVHPELRDRDDPRVAATPRVNALKQLENDDNGLLGDLKFTAMLDPRGIGPILGYDLSIGTLTPNDMKAKAVSGLSQAELEAIAGKHETRLNRLKAALGALNAEEPERAAAMLADLKRCEEGVAALCAAFGAAGGFDGQSPLTLPELTEFLLMVRQTLEVPSMTKSDQKESGTPAPASSAPTQTNGAAAPASSMSAGVPGTISSRADVERSLDSIIAFYERTEPASPIPLLARRMRRMVPMDFLELMEEVAPSGMKEFKSVAGMEDPRKK